MYDRGARPVESFELLIPRELLDCTAHALAAAGWSPGPDLWFHRGEEHLKLNWRVAPVSAEIAADPVEFPRLASAGIQGSKIEILANEEMLLHALAGHRDSSEVDWRCDALQLLRGGCCANIRKLAGASANCASSGARRFQSGRGAGRADSK
jgi:hypothetical protein